VHCSVMISRIVITPIVASHFGWQAACLATRRDTGLDMAPAAKS